MRVMDIHLQLHACGRVCCVLHSIPFLRTCSFCSRGDERPRLGWRHRTCFTPFVFPRARVTIRNYLHSFPLLLQCCYRGRSLVHASFISSFRVKLLRQLSLRSYSMSICSPSPSQSTLLLCPYLLPIPPTSTLPLHPRLPSFSCRVYMILRAHCVYSSLLVLPMTTALPRRVGKADTTGRNPLPPMEGILSPFLLAFALCLARFFSANILRVL